MNPLSIMLLSLVKKSARLNQERNMHKSNTLYMQKQSRTVVDKCGFDLRGQQGMDLSSGGSLIMDYGLFWPEATALS